MKDLRKLFSRRYSAVNTREENISYDPNKSRKSLTTNKTIRGLSIVDSFFNKRKDTTRLPKCSFLFLTGGLLAILTAILVQIYHPYDMIFKWKLILAEDGEIFNLWEKPPIDLYVKIYLYNITNADEFLAGKEKMRIEEVGPYVYKEIMEHDDIIFNDNKTISTHPRHPLVWQEEMSEGHQENDTVIMLNIALLSIAQVAADKSYFFRLPINLVIRQTKSQPIVKMTARDFMFGYESPLTTLGNTLMPDWISFDKVGLIDRMYDFSSDFETFHTGEDDPSISGLYDTYMGSRNLQQWKGDHCSDIHLASDGTKFKSFIEPNDTVLFFRKSMCRPQKMIRTGDEIIKQDLAAYKYIFEENALDNGYYNEKNKCYCRNGYCQPRGLIDVNDCYYGFPISLSYPHFMDADPKLLEDVEGSTPNRSLHESYFLINPQSGLPLECSVKFQINMHLRDVSSMAHVERFSDKTFPMLWFEITMLELPIPLKNRFNLYLNVLPYIDIIGFWGGLTIGVLCILFAIIRAILNIQQFFTVTQKTSNHNKYDKVNIKSDIYKPCEMKVIEMNEKNCIKSNEMKIENHENLQKHCEYLLENEQPISDCESSDSDDSQNTTDYSLDNGIHESSEATVSDKISYNSSNSDNLKVENSTEHWKMGEASSLIEDIGNNEFPVLRITESNENINNVYKHFDNVV